MNSVKTSRNFHGPLISLRALCELEDRALPYSIADLVADDGVRQFNGKLSTGDVICTWKMTVSQNGFWSVSADFHDGGTVAGDFFFAEFLLDKGQALGVKLEGSILNIADSRSLSVSKDGSDRRIRENWHKFPGGPSVRLHAAPSVGGSGLVTDRGDCCRALRGVRHRRRRRGRCRHRRQSCGRRNICYEALQGQGSKRFQPGLRGSCADRAAAASRRTSTGRRADAAMIRQE